MKLKELRTKAGLTQSKMGKIFEIPKRTIENWETGTRKCPVYVEKLLINKLEEIIMGREVLEKAMKIKKTRYTLPNVEVGEIVELGKIWNGKGEVPTCSYSYLLTDEGVPIWINYCFEFLGVKEEDPDYKTLVKVTKIELL